MIHNDYLILFPLIHKLCDRYVHRQKFYKNWILPSESTESCIPFAACRIENPMSSRISVGSANLQQYM